METKAEFMECAECAAKPGSPTLCPSCLHNRSVIDGLSSKVKDLESQVEFDSGTFGEAKEIVTGMQGRDSLYGWVSLAMLILIFVVFFGIVYFSRGGAK